MRKPLKYPLNTFKITYSYETKMFSMVDKDGQLVGQDVSGRELGRDAWDSGAEEVVYDYDCKIDHDVPLIPRHEKYKVY